MSAVYIFTVATHCQRYVDFNSVVLPSMCSSFLGILVEVTLMRVRITPICGAKGGGSRNSGVEINAIYMKT